MVGVTAASIAAAPFTGGASLAGTLVAKEGAKLAKTHWPSDNVLYDWKGFYMGNDQTIEVHGRYGDLNSVYFKKR